ncbi:hypothetical protein HII27_07530 [Kluyvera sp. SCKS090646]|uniref:Uncharacterized protein n=1 Tax=Kluyvera sichuanensis TaxID=2725494 RepID=A0ABR6RR11_9ENTR|nr:hypothetical protein [Kluyvera sichuanensis]MBC1185568.1 hypothetical protein [Kluyvera sichuanensis]
MSHHNTLALLNWYRSKNVAAVMTPAGIVFMGMRNITAQQRETLLAIPQTELESALRWQQ